MPAVGLFHPWALWLDAGWETNYYILNLHPYILNLYPDPWKVLHGPPVTQVLQLWIRLSVYLGMPYGFPIEVK